MRKEIPRRLVAALAVVTMLMVPTSGAVPSTQGPNASTDQAPGDIVPGGPGLDDRDAILQAAHRSIEHREGLVGTVLPGGVAPMLGQQHLNLEAARQILVINDADHGSDLHRAIALARQGTLWQAATMDLEWKEPVPLTGYETPSQALLELASRHDVDPTPEQREAIRGLDEAPEPIRSALAGFVDAFLALDTAATLAFRDADIEGFAALHGASMENLGDLDGKERLSAAALGAQDVFPRLETVGIDLSLVLPTRAQFLDTVFDLYAALNEVGVRTADTCTPVQVLPAFSIDMTNCPSTYTQDVALLLDAGGSDTYRNNAGGSNLESGSCGLMHQGTGSAALVDLGVEGDVYGIAENPRSCGANGGGAGGVGFLLDADGGDTYHAGRWGTNGGGLLGAGFLLDHAGNDVYDAAWGGTNGGGGGGAGFLLDTGGDDTYTADGAGANGGGSSGQFAVYGIPIFGFVPVPVPGVGFLLDHAGNDTYTGSGSGANGGGNGGVGFLFDHAGDDTYTANTFGTNGGGIVGAGFLFDQSGSDTYTSTDVGTNGGGFHAGAGLLLDQAGDDTYVAEGCGVNGGGAEGSCWPFIVVPGDLLAGTGLLLDHGGTDEYQDDLVGHCWDCSLVPKGLAGAHIDRDAPQP